MPLSILQRDLRFSNPIYAVQYINTATVLFSKASFEDREIIIPANEIGTRKQWNVFYRLFELRSIRWREQFYYPDLMSVRRFFQVSFTCVPVKLKLILHLINEVSDHFFEDGSIRLVELFCSIT